MLLISNLPYPAIMLLVLAGKGKDKKEEKKKRELSSELTVYSLLSFPRFVLVL